eukprot:CAMPEP_0117025562 /NCGR_PEP_ID=MMETSP0472-20121206/18872_1 /TAXON_ID=693140 ORGANISM="Tiarina fusus, Strain LIS" /NCGR_SAMPLE_ID=MMETSP0472 /ASSEMBLY_ACC=CAM_ASM_000603 /LENGTH=707 /DNA_ID=CAMNT_0004732315 /DNA_START=172 /DNA_END=2295 /DNA_ORIENTATION=+
MMSAPPHQVPPQYVGSPPTMASSDPRAAEMMRVGAAPPPEYLQMQQAQMQQPPSNMSAAMSAHNNMSGVHNNMSSVHSNQHSQHSNSMSGVHSNMTGGGVHGNMSAAPAPPPSLPWTVGSTDGSFATMTLMKQQQYQQNPRVSASPPAHVAAGAAIGATGEATNNLAALAAVQSGKSLYHDRLFHQPSSSVESILSASCDVMGFDIAEMWLRTGPKTHQLTNSHLRPTALEDSVRNDLVDVYYGDKSSERTHRLSPALCKRAKDANDVVWVTAHTPHGAEALRCSISNVRTAVAVPVCHEASNTNITIIYFSIRRIVMRPAAVEFLVHMSLCAAVGSVNSLSEDGLAERPSEKNVDEAPQPGNPISRSEHVTAPRKAVIVHQQQHKKSITGAELNLQWRQLQNVEYLTDGGNSWIHTAVFNGRPVVVKTLKPECQDVALAINEIEGELDVHSRLNHPNIVSLLGAGLTSKGVRFVVLERLDGGTLTQMLGYDTRIRDRRRRFWRKKQFSYLDVLRCARAIASAMQYCHDAAIPGSMVLHRDLKPDNIGFTLNGTVKILDFGLAKLLENADPKSNEVYAMSGETGSLRYMAPEVADALPYNNRADVYSFGVILWELNAGKKPFAGLNRELFYERVVHSGERPPLNKKWPQELCKLITDCWSPEIENRPAFAEIVESIDELLAKEKEGGVSKRTLRKISGLIDRHSTWF